MNRLQTLGLLADHGVYAYGMEAAKRIVDRLGLPAAVQGVCALALSSACDEGRAAIDGALDMLMIKVCA